MRLACQIELTDAPLLLRKLTYLTGFHHLQSLGYRAFRHPQLTPCSEMDNFARFERSSQHAFVHLPAVLLCRLPSSTRYSSSLTRLPHHRRNLRLLEPAPRLTRMCHLLSRLRPRQP